MRIAFFGLAYHARTGSSRFILDLLGRHGTVDTIFAEADPAALRRQAEGFDETRYDAILVWQLHEAFALLSGRHPNVTFAPMLDAMTRGGAFLWRKRFATAKILCFAQALQQEVARRGAMQHLARYYPEAGPRSAAADDPDARGFLWYRRREIGPERILALTAGQPMARLAVHDAPDPGHEADAAWTTPPHVGELVRTTWSADRGAFDAQLATANLFFASRPLEGIGMSFLEAMGAGLCVVAPDAPTMNEYISHGRNGLLYAPDRTRPIDLSARRAMGAAARESVLRGRDAWLAAVPSIERFLLTPRRDLARRILPTATPPSDGMVAVVRQPDQALPQAAWIVFRPPGQHATQPFPLADVPAGIGIVVGQHLQASRDGTDVLVRPAAPMAAWHRLLDGEVGPEGPRGVPIAAATVFRRDVLLRLDAGFPATDAALFDLLMRAEALGIVSAEAEQVVARREAAANGTRAWTALVRDRAGDAAAARFVAAVAAARKGAAARRAAARPAAFALAVISALDQLSPRLADAVEGLFLGATVRRLRGLLRRARPA